MSMSCRKFTIIAGMLLSLNAFAEQHEAPERTVVLNGQKLVLEDIQQRCALKTVDQKTLAMDIPWPCQFTVDRDGKSHVATFRNVPIVIVTHVAPDPENPRNCFSQTRAIRLIKGHLETSPVSLSAACYTGVGDQKEYTGVFDW
jgi:hypothetical protein